MGTLWSRDEDARIAAYVERGVSSNRIPMAEFPGRTYVAIRTRASLIASGKLDPNREERDAERLREIGKAGREMLGGDALRRNAICGSRQLLKALVGYAKRHHGHTDLAKLQVMG